MLHVSQPLTNGLGGRSTRWVPVPTVNHQFTQERGAAFGHQVYVGPHTLRTAERCKITDGVDRAHCGDVDSDSNRREVRLGAIGPSPSNDLIHAYSE